MEFGIRGTGVVTKLQFQFVGTDWGKRAKLKPRISDMDGGYRLTSHRGGVKHVYWNLERTETLSRLSNLLT